MSTAFFSKASRKLSAEEKRLTHSKILSIALVKKYFTAYSEEYINTGDENNPRRAPTASEKLAKESALEDELSIFLLKIEQDANQMKTRFIQEYTASPIISILSNQYNYNFSSRNLTSIDFINEIDNEASNVDIKNYTRNTDFTYMIDEKSYPFIFYKSQADYGNTFFDNLDQITDLDINI